MKTRSIFYILPLTLMVLSSCVKDVDFGASQVTLSLQTDGVELVTKATEDGEDEYNENLIGTIHWYFFDDSDNWLMDGTQTVNKSASTDVSLSNFSTSNFDALFSGRDSVKVLVIANATTSAGASGKTLDDIKASALATLTSHGKQASFAMCGEGVLEKGTGTATLKVASTTSPISMKRIASKFRINLAIKNNYHNSVDESDWKPDIANLKMSFKNLEPKGFANSADANSTTLNTVNFTASDFTQTSTGSTTSPFTNPQVQTLSDPLYSYPRAWEPVDTDYPYIYITLPWSKTDNSKTETTYYRVLFPTSKFESNKLYDLTINLDGLGSMVPEASVTVDDMSLIVNGSWKDAIADTDKHDTDADMAVPHVLAVDKNVYTIYNEDSISIPFVSSHDCSYTASITSTERTQHSLPVNQNSRLGDDISGITIQVKNDENVIYFEHQLKNMQETGTDYDFRELIYTIKLYHTSDDSVCEYITIRQRPSIVVEKYTSGNSYIFIHGAKLPSSGDNGDHSYRILKTSTSGSEDIQRVTAGVLPTSGTLKDFVIGDPRAKETATFSEILKKATIYHETSRNYYRGEGYSGTPTASGTFKFEKSSTAATTIYDLDGNPEDNIEYYYPVKESGSENTIAPEFIIASGYPGVTSHYMNVEAATLRCAAYQELGYPAGRWRLPTKAELTYVFRLQNDGYISKIFNSSGGITTPYVTANGVVVVSSSGVGVATSGYKMTYGSVRCVYDSWYWDQVDKENGWEDRSRRMTTFTYGDMEIE